MIANINLSIDVPRTYSIALLKEQLTEYAKQLVSFSREKEEDLVPYTIEELQTRVAESEAQFNAGEVYSQDEVHQMMDEFVKSQSL